MERLSCILLIWLPIPAGQVKTLTLVSEIFVDNFENSSYFLNDLARNPQMELVCPAGSLPALKQAVDHGADCVYLGFRDATNARNFVGLNFDEKALQEGISYVHARRKKVLLALNTYPVPGSWDIWKNAVDRAARCGVDAMIVADPGLMQYACDRHPDLRLHLSVQGSATNYDAINFYTRHFHIARVVLPRVLSIEQVELVVKNTEIEIEVFGFGSLCVMVEGRCALSSYVTGEAPNNSGVCSPAKAVRWQPTPKGLESRLNGVLIDRYADNEKASYPTICKGRYEVGGENYYAIEEPASLNTLELLPRLKEIGVSAIKIEGRQRSPAYTATATRVWREALDSCLNDTASYQVRPEWVEALGRLSEGQQQTLGAYYRSWK